MYTRPLLYVAGCNASIPTCLASLWPCPATMLLLKLPYYLETEAEGVDSGGEDGHVPEAFKLGEDQPSSLAARDALAVTRCTTSRSAMTAYFCGCAVATNQDRSKGDASKPHQFGVDTFTASLKANHAAGELAGTHRRAVYRLGIGSLAGGVAGYDHAWSIIAQPDGRFWWLQSFISQYSLATWMGKLDAAGSRSLSLAALLQRLRKISGLTRIKGWTPAANAAYLFLFDVDKNARPRGHAEGDEWKPEHRLSVFAWDTACEY